MPLGKASKKVSNGKLVRVEVTFEGDVIESVRITGDFFLHPEEALLDIETLLKGISIDEAEGKLEAFSKERQLEFVGLSPADIVLVLKEAMR